jgi:hypothetical protein
MVWNIPIEILKHIYQVLSDLFNLRKYSSNFAYTDNLKLLNYDHFYN